MDILLDFQVEIRIVFHNIRQRKNILNMRQERLVQDLLISHQQALTEGDEGEKRGLTMKL